MTRRKKRRISKQRLTMFILFGCYITFMLYLLFFQRIGRNLNIPYADYVSSYVNMIPFKTIIQYASDVHSGTRYAQWAFTNLGGNVLLFIPLGFFIPSIWRKQRKFSKFILTVLVSIACVEILQLVLMLGSCDIDDLIFNVLGAAIGFGIWKIKPIAKMLKKYGII